MEPSDQAILVTHQPMWLADWFHEKAGCHNLRQLVRCHLRGRARIHLAGKVLPNDPVPSELRQACIMTQTAFTISQHPLLCKRRCYHRSHRIKHILKQLNTLPL